MWDTVSPFEFDGPVAPEKLIGRRQEVDTIKQWTVSGRFMALVAPRRFGKTSLIRKVALDGERNGLTVIAADLFEVASLTDFVLRLERAWSKHTPKRWRSSVSKILTGAQVGVSIAGSGFALTLADKPQTDPLPALHTLLDLPLQLAKRERGRTLVVFDEFQSVAKLEGAEALIRSHVQHHRDVASYLFSGSEPGMLANAFDDRARPFYGQVETFRLDRLPAPELSEAVERRFAESGRDVSEVLAGFITAAQGHPQRAMLLAHLLWQEVRAGYSATIDDLHSAIAAALHRTDPEARATMSGLTDGRRKTLRAVAEYGSPMAARALRTLDLPKTTAQKAARFLLSTGLIEEMDGAWRVIDPLLARWICANYSTRT